MDDIGTAWLIASGTTPTGAPELGFEWYGVKLAESAFRPLLPDTDLFDLCLYLRDKTLDDDRYEGLARRAELRLMSRMTGGRPSKEERGSTDFEPGQARRATDALCSGKLTPLQLIDLAELAHSERHDTKFGARWQAVYDLARIQILRRIKWSAPLPPPDNGPRATTRSAADPNNDTENYDWLDKPFHDDDWETSQVRRELEMAEAVYRADMPDDLLLRLHFFVRDRFDDNDVWGPLLAKTEGLMLARMSGGPHTRPARYGRGFDPEDHALLLEALREDALTSKDLLNLYLVARMNSGSPHVNNPHRHLTTEWKPIYPLIRAQILARLAAGGHSKRIVESDVPGGQMPNYDWLDDVYSDDGSAEDDDVELGWEREELRLAEEAFSPDMPDELLLRYYRFVMDHGEEDGSVWDVVRDKTSRLTLSRIHGGPDKRADKYRHGFDPKDHALAAEAISLNAVPYTELLSLYRVAWGNKGYFPEWNDNKQFAPHWGPVFDLIRDKLLAIMAGCRAEKQAASKGDIEGAPTAKPEGDLS